jgi:hypothetical protein
VWRWSAPHPEWTPPEPGAVASWPREVGCVLYDDGEDAVWIDPLAPSDDEGFWEWADARCAGRSVSVLLTIGFHSRSREEFVARYGACAQVPASVAALAFPALDETMYLLPAARILVPGDRLIGADGGELALCPPSWLSYLQEPPSVEQMREQLGALLVLDVEAVLVSHGEPVLHGGRAAIARALAAS